VERVESVVPKKAPQKRGMRPKRGEDRYHLFPGKPTRAIRAERGVKKKRVAGRDSITRQEGKVASASSSLGGV